MRAGGGQLDLERVAGDRRALQHAAGGLREQRELLAQRGGDGRRDLDVAEADVRARGPARHRAPHRAGELLEVERVASALGVQRAGRRAVDRVAQELPGLVARQGAELDPGRRSVAVRPVERGGEVLRELPGAHREGEEHPRRRRSPQQRAEELGGPRVRPVQVVQHEHEGRGRGEQLQQLPHGPVRAVALVLQRRRGGGGGQRRKDEAELRPGFVAQAAQALRREPGDVLLQRVDERPEGQVALELRRAAGEHELSAGLGAPSELRQQAGLADPRLARELDRARPPPLDLVKRGVERAELRGAPDEVLGEVGHGVVPRRRP